MKFLLLGPWPVAGGSMLVPEGTMLEWDADPEAARIAGVLTEPTWCGVALPLPMPMNAKALDQASYDQMVEWVTPQSDQLVRLLHYAAGVKPKA